MKRQVLHTVWRYIFGEAAGKIWNWSLLRVNELAMTRRNPQDHLASVWEPVKLIRSSLIRSIHPPTHPSICPSTLPCSEPSIHPTVHSPIHSIHPSICPSTLPFCEPFIHPSIHPSTQQSIHWSTYWFTHYPSIHPAGKEGWPASPEPHTMVKFLHKRDQKLASKSPVPDSLRVDTPSTPGESTPCPRSFTPTPQPKSTRKELAVKVAQIVAETGHTTRPRDLNRETYAIMCKALQSPQRSAQTRTNIRDSKDGVWKYVTNMTSAGRRTATPVGEFWRFMEISI